MRVAEVALEWDFTVAQDIRALARAHIIGCNALAASYPPSPDMKAARRNGFRSALKGAQSVFEHKNVVGKLFLYKLLIVPCLFFSFLELFFVTFFRALFPYAG